MVDVSRVWEELATGGGRIVYLILDGAAGLPHAPAGWTALEAARTFNLDALARNATCGMLELAGPGITPCCAAGQLALFGYDPLRFRLPREVVAALGIQVHGDARRTARHGDGERVVGLHAGVGGADPDPRLCRRLRDRLGLPSLEQRFGLRGLCIARDPVARGVSALLGLDLVAPPPDLDGQFDALQDHYGGRHDLYLLHVEQIEAAGAEADFEHKVRRIEQVDARIPQLLGVRPDVLVVTADHSTPSQMGVHSWHPVPVLLHSPYVRADDVERFDEHACARGMLGLRPATDLMGLALANAGRLKELGA